MPFVLGPLNGGLPWPREFDSTRRKENEWLTYVRDFYKFLPGRRRMFGAASMILVGSRHTEGEIPEEFSSRVRYLPENGIDEGKFNTGGKRGPSFPLRACFVGRLVPLKGVDMFLEAAEDHLRSRRLVFDVLGDGPSADELRSLVEGLGVGGAVTFHGWVDHAIVPSILEKSDVLAFPSIKDFGSGAVLEAMALGVVPLVVDYGGPGELVTPGRGLKVPMGSRESIVAGLRSKLSEILADPGMLSALSAEARRACLEGFTWSAKARKIRTFYDELLEARGEPGATARRSR